MTLIHHIWCGPIPDNLVSCFLNTKSKFNNAYRLWCFRQYFYGSCLQAYEHDGSIQFLDAVEGPQAWLFNQNQRWMIIIGALQKLRAFSSLKDIFEIVVLYLHGGFYLDTTIDLSKTDLSLFEADKSSNPNPRFLQILSGSTSFSKPGCWESFGISSEVTSYYRASDTLSVDYSTDAESIHAETPLVPQNSPVSTVSPVAPPISPISRVSPVFPSLEAGLDMAMLKFPQNFSRSPTTESGFDISGFYSPQSSPRRSRSFDGTIDVWMAYAPNNSPLLAKILHYIFCAWWYGCDGNSGMSQPCLAGLNQLNFRQINQNWLKAMLSPSAGISQVREDIIGRNIICPVFLACSEEGYQYIDDNFWDADFTETGYSFAGGSESTSDRFVRCLKIKKTHHNSWRNKNLSDLQQEFFGYATDDPNEWRRPR